MPDAVQAEKEEVGTRQARNRALLRQEERQVHKFQTQLVSLRNSHAEKVAEVEALERAADPAACGEKQQALQRAERSMKARNDEVAALRKQLARLQAVLEQHAEELEALQLCAVRC